MKKESAERYIEEMLIKQMDKFCPLIKDKCRADCECFEEGWIDDDSEYKSGGSIIEYYPCKPGCACSLLKGV